MGYVTVLGFIWNNVLPILKEILKILGSGTYDYIKENVHKVEEAGLAGLDKRAHVYTNTVDFLKEKGVTEIGVFGMSAVYLLIEIAVMNLKKEGMERA
jgi:hypothetical protein